MAHAGKDTGGSQFFVCHGTLPHLDGVHTVFGKIDESGMKTILSIKQGDVVNSIRVTD
jgi:cyclophilin family peptidyl-prolyl cis-trans isomerase